METANQALAPKRQRKKPTLTDEQRAKKAATIRNTTAKRKAAGKKPPGRAPLLQDDAATLRTLKGLAQIQCTTKEAAAVLGVSEPTFIAYLKRSESARDTWERGKGVGLASARRKMWQKAFEGRQSVTMQIWLSKQYLGMTDKVEEKVEQNTTVDVMISDAATTADRKFAHLLAARAGGSGVGTTH